MSADSSGSLLSDVIKRIYFDTTTNTASTTTTTTTPNGEM